MKQICDCYWGFVGIVLLSSISSLCVNAASRPKDQDQIQARIKGFLKSHCNAKNQTVEQHELDHFLACNPTQAASTFTNLETFKGVNQEDRHKAIQKALAIQCAVWPEQKKCQKKNFQLIEKCFDGQQSFVFYFMLALSDTICQDEGEIFINFWERGGEECLKDHLPHLTKDIAKCFVFTSTATKEALDRNVHQITQCIGEQFSNCASADSKEVVEILLNDIESFYHETRRAASTSSIVVTNAAILSLTFLTVMQQIILGQV